MKLRGEYVVRKIVDEIVVVPVGKTSLEFKGMIVLNEVSEVIWSCLKKETTFEEILQCILEQFEVSEQEAKEDILSILDTLRCAKLLEE